MSSTVQKKIIRAAGGLLWRRCGSEYEIAIVHRKRYDDWTLPKGKLNDGESWEGAALREVREETGVIGKVLGFAGAIAYDTAEGQKVVRFWNMIADGERVSETDSGEVAEVIWLPLDAAVRRVQYPLERALLEASRAPDHDIQGVKRRWPHFRQSVSLERLANTIETFEPELEAVIEEARSSEKHKARWERAAKELLGAAKRSLADKDVERGWRCLKAADRFSLYGFDGDGLRNEAKAILAEAADETKGLTKWRAESVRDLLTDTSGELRKDPALKPWEVVRAKRIVDEHSDNRYHKLALLKKRLRDLTILGLVAIASWIFLFSLLEPIAIRTLPDIGGSPFQKLLLWIAVLTTAVLGALFSGFSSSIATEHGKTRIPDELSTSTITFARLTLAMVSAIAISVFLASGVLNLPKPSPELLLAVAFASGFSERLIMRAIESITKAT